MELVEKDYATFCETNDVKGDCLKKFNDEDMLVGLPEEIKKISNEAFYKNNTLYGIFIPDTVTNIEDGYRIDAEWEDEVEEFVGAFSGVENLRQVRLSKNLK